MVMRRQTGANVSLPMPTKFLASAAHSIGGFGLVARGITIAYHRAILGLGRPWDTFTRPYHRTEGLDLYAVIMD